MADGQTVTIKLRARLQGPRVDFSSVARDESGHGWPAYATGYSRPITYSH